MKALILQNKVVQIEANEFPVHPALQWVEIPEDSAIEVRWIYTGSSFIPPPPLAPGTGGAGGSGVGGDMNIGGRGGDGVIGGPGGDGIGNGLNIGGVGGNSVHPVAQPKVTPAQQQPWWRSIGAFAVGIATIIGTLIAVIQWLGD